MKREQAVLADRSVMDQDEYHPVDGEILKAIKCRNIFLMDVKTPLFMLYYADGSLPVALADALHKSDMLGKVDFLPLNIIGLQGKIVQPLFDRINYSFYKCVTGQVQKNVMEFQIE